MDDIFRIYKYINYIFFLLIFIWISSGCEDGKDKTTSFTTAEHPGFYQNMDYGSVIEATIRMRQPKGSLVRKGLAIRLDYNTAMIFDQDLMSFSAGIDSGWIDISETSLTSTK